MADGAPVNIRQMSDDALRDELLALFSDPAVRKAALYLRLKEEFDSRQRRFVRDWQVPPVSSGDAI